MKIETNMPTKPLSAVWQGELFAMSHEEYLRRTEIAAKGKSGPVAKGAWERGAAAMTAHFSAHYDQFRSNGQ